MKNEIKYCGVSYHISRSISCYNIGLWHLKNVITLPKCIDENIKVLCEREKTWREVLNINLMIINKEMKIGEFLMKIYCFLFPTV